MISEYKYPLDAIDWQMCRAQGALFVWAIDMGYDIETFAEKYMQSDICHREMDARYSWMQTETPIQITPYILPELRGLKIAKKLQDKEIAQWIGWEYRYIFLYCNRELSSKEIYELFPYKNLASGWIGLHTLSFKVAADVLLEGKGLKEPPYKI